MTAQHHSPATIRTMQIIALALVQGVVFFALIVVFALGGLQQPPKGNQISLIGAGVALAAFVLHLVIPNLVAERLARRAGNDEGELLGAYQAKIIIGLALLEGAAFLNVIALMIEHNDWSLVVAGGLVLLMLAAFPTRTRVEQWVEARRRAE